MFALWSRLKQRHRQNPQPPQFDTSRRVRQTYEGEAYRAPEFKLETAWISDAGCVRESNEDKALFVESQHSATLESRGCLMLVADGVGGHSAGEEASRIAVETISRSYFESDLESEEINAALREAFAKANQAIYYAAQSQPQWQGMGTTCTALALCGGQAYAAQVGDSRLYLVRDDRVYQLSEDHSAVMEMVRMGVMTIAEARAHEDRNIILRALGTKPEVAVTVWEKPFPVRDEDVFVLCTDGLFDLVADEEIKQVVTNEAADAACQQLIDLAKAKGGYDNITVGVVRVTAGDLHTEESFTSPVTS